jgi:cobalt/nickel transport system permease protein
VKDRVPQFLLRRQEPVPHNGRGRFHRPLADRALEHLGAIIGATFRQWETASRKGLLQALDARVKLLGLAFLLVVATTLQAFVPTLVLAGFVFILAFLSRLNLLFFYRRLGAFTCIFGLLLMAPAALNIVTEGRIIIPLATSEHFQSIRFLPLPRTIGVTAEGVWIVGFVALRVMNCLSLSFLLFHTTPLPQIIRAFRIFRIPGSLLVVFTLTFKYIFIFSTVLEDMYLAMKSRLLGPVTKSGTGEWTAGRMALLYGRTRSKAEEVYQAMTSRCFDGGVVFLPWARLRMIDAIAGLCLLLCGGFLLWI